MPRLAYTTPRSSVSASQHDLLCAGPIEHRGEYCRSLPKQAVETDELYERACTERPTRVAGVFNDTSAQQFVTLPRSAQLDLFGL